MAGHKSSSGKDRLSTLPPEIRSQILSLLPTVDAARVGLLSKLLRSACYSLSRLSFDYSQFPETENKLFSFVNFIDQTIAHHDKSVVTTLELWFWPLFDAEVSIKLRWVRFAIVHRVEKLVLYGKIDKIKLPNSLFTCQTLVKLELAIPGLVFTWEKLALPNLRKLKLKFLKLAEQTSGNDLFSNLPALKKLSMFYCNIESPRTISVSSEKLEEFIMCCPELYNCGLKLQAPSLSNFIYFSNDEEMSDLDVHSSGFLFVINGGDAFVVNGSNNELIPSLIKVTKELFTIVHISLSHWLVEYLSMARDMLKQATRCEFHYILRLEIDIWPIMDHLSVLILLVSRCPNLIELNLVLKTPQRRAHQLLNEDSLVEYRNLGGLCSVESVSIMNFRGDETEMMLVRFLLANMIKLCLMRIVLGDFTGRDMRWTLFEILTFENASEYAEITFE